MILVANKVDLVHLRKVKDEQGRELAASLKVSYTIKTCAIKYCKMSDMISHYLSCVLKQPSSSEQLWPLKDEVIRYKYSLHAFLSESHHLWEMT